MITLSILRIQVPFLAQTEVPPDEFLDKAERVIDIWNSIGPLMAILGVMALALIVVGAAAYFNRNSTSTAIKVLANITDRQDKEIAELKTQGSTDREKYIQSISVVAEQSTRANDLFEAMNNRGGQRDQQQQRLVESQAQIAADLKVMSTQGSQPVQDIKTKVGEILDLTNRIDSRTADWDGILTAISPLLVELGALRIEAKKHRTQPIPQIAPSPSGDIVIEGTVSGTIVEGDSP